MKKFLSMISILGIYSMLSLCPVMAESSSDLTAQKSTIQINLNESDNQYDVVWNDKHDRLLIGSDFITKYFGADVKIENNSIDISKNGHILHFEVGNEFYLMDNLGGRKVGALAKIDNGKAYLPIRYICEAFGASIDFDMSGQNVTITTNAISMNEDVKKYFENVQVFDQSTIRISGEKTVYFDPRRVLGEPHDADYIFITHTHNDHYEIDSIKRVMKPSTIIYITEDGVEQAKKDGLENVVGVQPNKEYSEGEIKFSTVSAYNTAAERKNHQKNSNWVGYIVDINGYKYYSSGDSDFTEEMKNLSKDIDVAFLPIDGKYNMGSEEAANAANAIMPKVAVPYHYNNFVPENRAEDFVNLLDENILGAIVTFKMQ